MPYPLTSGDPYQVIQHLCKRIPDPIIFDVGAHDGSVSLQFAKLLPNAKIYAFEPFPESFAKLRINTRNTPKIHCFNIGLSDLAGVQKFHSNSSSATNSLLVSDPNGRKIWGKGLLETTAVIDAQFDTLDAVVREMKLPRIDLLKMDVQGAEPLVLKGAQSSCDLGLIGMVFSEIITQPTYKGQLRLDVALSAFYDRGFDLVKFFELNHDDRGYLRQLDALFVHNPSISSFFSSNRG
jgi:FkbM family methyltransferase